MAPHAEAPERPRCRSRGRPSAGPARAGRRRPRSSARGRPPGRSRHRRTGPLPAEPARRDSPEELDAGLFRAPDQRLVEVRARRTPRPAASGKIPSADQLAVDVADAAEGERLARPSSTPSSRRCAAASGISPSPQALSIGGLEAFEDGGVEAGEAGAERGGETGRAAARRPAGPSGSSGAAPPGASSGGGHRRAPSAPWPRPSAAASPARAAPARRRARGAGPPAAAELAGGGARERPRREHLDLVDGQAGRAEHRLAAGLGQLRELAPARPRAPPRRRAPAPRLRRPPAASSPPPRSRCAPPASPSTARSISSGA